MNTKRLDLELVERGLVESRSLAQRMIMAGQVRVNGQVLLKPSTKIPEAVSIEIDELPKYVSRGGEKLAAALEEFTVVVEGKICADVGASTGGFSDCLLQNGAERVYAIDVGHNILDWRIRNDPRVIVMEDTNARYIEQLPERVGLVTIDVSFISLKIILPVVKNWLKISANKIQPKRGGSEFPDTGPDGDVIALIKPQFEAGRAEAQKGKGVVKDPQVHKKVLLELLKFAEKEGYGIQNLIQSPLKGAKGNIEYLTHLNSRKRTVEPIENLIERVLKKHGG